ncbi:esterase [Streptomyces spiroverticillatus]|uniref:Esterase n=1 Tax=Streptomyces finlayi TaxID=67296 RepID=A0A918X3H4_9ACTN|nr:alpha/beta hydrolase [Streptomyces finlayi]GHA27127.1 esterase [Streptomyces spiroverticillatus]GHD08373.1 esterase [Streptomyces finlayi]
MTVEPTPEVRRLIDLSTANFPALGTEVTDIAEVRAFFASRPAPPPSGIEVAYVADEDADGVRVRVYDPTDGADGTPVVVFAHGGGFCVCGLDSHDGFCRAMAVETQAVVISVDYRLAPEHPFPAAPDDCYTALLWAAKHYAGRRLAVAGDSAGANLATVMALTALDRGGPELVCQALYYPMLDPERRGDSHRRNAQGYFLTADHLRWYWDGYLPEAADRTDPYATPLHRSDLSGLPPTHLVTAGLDPLCDDAWAYAHALAGGGVDVRLAHLPGMFHGFLSMAGALPEALAARTDAFAALRGALHG